MFHITRKGRKIKVGMYYNRIETVHYRRRKNLISKELTTRSDPYYYDVNRIYWRDNFFYHYKR